MNTSFKQKPIAIAAIKVSDALDLARSSLSELPDWLLEQFAYGQILFGSEMVLIMMPIGHLPVNRSSWLVCVAGSVFPVSAAEFEAAYEPA